MGDEFKFWIQVGNVQWFKGRVLCFYSMEFEEKVVEQWGVEEVIFFGLGVVSEV